MNLQTLVITGDNTLVDGYDVETKVHHSKSDNSHHNLNKPELVVLKLCSFSSGWHGIVYSEFCSGSTVNDAFCVNFMQRLRKKEPTQEVILVSEKSWKLHHDNACSPFLTRCPEVFGKTPDTCCPSTGLYFHDLAPADVYLFSKEK